MFVLVTRFSACEVLFIVAEMAQLPPAGSSMSTGCSGCTRTVLPRRLDVEATARDKSFCSPLIESGQGLMQGNRGMGVSYFIFFAGNLRGCTVVRELDK